MEGVENNYSPTIFAITYFTTTLHLYDGFMILKFDFKETAHM